MRGQARERGKRVRCRRHEVERLGDARAGRVRNTQLDVVRADVGRQWRPGHQSGRCVDLHACRPLDERKRKRVVVGIAGVRIVSVRRADARRGAGGRREHRCVVRRRPDRERERLVVVGSAQIDHRDAHRLLSHRSRRRHPRDHARVGVDIHASGARNQPVSVVRRDAGIAQPHRVGPPRQLDRRGRRHTDDARRVGAAQVADRPAVLIEQPTGVRDAAAPDGREHRVVALLAFHHGVSRVYTHVQFRRQAIECAERKRHRALGIRSEVVGLQRRDQAGVAIRTAAAQLDGDRGADGTHAAIGHDDVHERLLAIHAQRRHADPEIGSDDRGPRRRTAIQWRAGRSQDHESRLASEYQLRRAVAVEIDDQRCSVRRGWDDFTRRSIEHVQERARHADAFVHELAVPELDQLDRPVTVQVRGQRLRERVAGNRIPQLAAVGLHRARGAREVDVERTIAVEVGDHGLAREGTGRVRPPHGAIAVEQRRAGACVGARVIAGVDHELRRRVGVEVADRHFRVRESGRVRPEQRSVGAIQGIPLPDLDATVTIHIDEVDIARRSRSVGGDPAAGRVVSSRAENHLETRIADEIGHPDRGVEYLVARRRHRCLPGERPVRVQGNEGARRRGATVEQDLRLSVAVEVCDRGRYVGRHARDGRYGELRRARCGIDGDDLVGLAVRDHERHRVCGIDAPVSIRVTQPARGRRGPSGAGDRARDAQAQLFHARAGQAAHEIVRDGVVDEASGRRRIGRGPGDVAARGIDRRPGRRFFKRPREYVERIAVAHLRVAGVSVGILHAARERPRYHGRDIRLLDLDREVLRVDVAVLVLHRDDERRLLAQCRRRHCPGDRSRRRIDARARWRERQPEREHLAGLRVGADRVGERRVDEHPRRRRRVDPQRRCTNGRQHIDGEIDRCRCTGKILHARRERAMSHVVMRRAEGERARVRVDRRVSDRCNELVRERVAAVGIGAVQLDHEGLSGSHLLVGHRVQHGRVVAFFRRDRPPLARCTTGGVLRGNARDRGVHDIVDELALRGRIVAFDSCLQRRRDMHGRGDGNGHDFRCPGCQRRGKRRGSQDGSGGRIGDAHACVRGCISEATIRDADVDGRNAGIAADARDGSDGKIRARAARNLGDLACLDVEQQVVQRLRIGAPVAQVLQVPHRPARGERERHLLLHAYPRGEVASAAAYRIGPGAVGHVTVPGGIDAHRCAAIAAAQDHRIQHGVQFDVRAAKRCERLCVGDRGWRPQRPRRRPLVVRHQDHVPRNPLAQWIERRQADEALVRILPLAQGDQLSRQRVPGPGIGRQIAVVGISVVDRISRIASEADQAVAIRLRVYADAELLQPEVERGKEQAHPGLVAFHGAGFVHEHDDFGRVGHVAGGRAGLRLRHRAHRIGRLERNRIRARGGPRHHPGARGGHAHGTARKHERHRVADVDVRRRSLVAVLRAVRGRGRGYARDDRNVVVARHHDVERLHAAATVHVGRFELEVLRARARARGRPFDDAGCRAHGRTGRCGDQRERNGVSFDIRGVGVVAPANARGNRELRLRRDGRCVIHRADVDRQCRGGGIDLAVAGDERERVAAEVVRGRRVAGVGARASEHSVGRRHDHAERKRIAIDIRA